MSSALVPTARMPLMDGVRAALMETLDRGDSFYTLSLLFEKVAAEFSLKAPKLRRTIEQFELDPENQWMMIKLMHMIPRELLRSIIQGTVAYDDQRWTRPGAAGQGTLAEYSHDGPGIYVIALSVNNRNGEFLSWDEMQIFLGQLEGYIDAYDIMATKQINARSQDDRFKVYAARFIEKQFRKPNDDGPLFFISSDSGASSARLLLASFRRRAPLQPPDDPKVPQYQSPLYVGCSEELSKDLEDHTLNQSLASINKLLGLTVSIMQAMDLEPIITKKVAIKTWLPDQLPAAEILLISLARSASFQDGFNIQDGGNKKGPTTRQGLVEVMCASHFRDNVKLSMEDMDTRKQFIANHQEMQTILKELEKDTLRKNVEEFEESVATVKRFLLPVLESHTERLERNLPELNRHKTTMRNLRVVIEKILECHIANQQQKQDET
ncbi:hypothetical protein Cob_v012670 [Colletotrichum orbiculare MAFF 240422]|uniref:Uncharacterized protein n=1 Tax=Colletotrichum orbiculare (strain 104-T / ATCC 96160 / CBS 514.97 / LARS 414 / MAFF 240422) TaxID=1213857 RepID=A0A484F838_COLOR|nr:hypothetical protein Cob_v012670 [Colletotrichum orbiculare MAFF 240422]